MNSSTDELNSSQVGNEGALNIALNLSLNATDGDVLSGFGKTSGALGASGHRGSIICWESAMTSCWWISSLIWGDEENMGCESANGLPGDFQWFHFKNFQEQKAE